MSRLIEKLRYAARLETEPFGFASIGKAHTRAGPVVVARITGEEKKLASLAAGADGLFIDIQKEEVADRIAKKLVRDKSSLAYGSWLNVSVPSIDFRVFNLDADMSAVKNNSEGKVLMVEPGLEDRFIRLLDSLPIDAVILADPEGQPCQMTLRNYMLCQRLALSLSKPLLIHSAFNFGPGEMELMWEYGIDGFMVDIDPANPALIKEFRSTVDGLELNPNRRKTRLSAFIPKPFSEQPQGMPEEPPDEEEEDY